METKVVVLPARWDDVVFENRNKDYGAYVLRKEYSKNVMISWGISIAMIAMVILFATLNKGEIKEKINKSGIIKCSFDDVLVIKNEHPKKQLKKPEKQPVKHNNLLPVVTSDVAPQDTTLSSPDDVIVSNIGEGSGTENVEGDPEGTEGGTGEPLPAPEPPKEVLVAEIMPEYAGGMESLMKFIQKNMRYPSSARRMGVDGTVYVSFVVTGDGQVAKVNVLRGIHEDCDKEAMRVISMLPSWKGGKQNGSPVNVKMVLPIKFNLKN